MKKLENPPVLGYIFKDEHVDWRDEDGNSILHYASWTGNIYLVRNLFDSAKGKKLITVSNNQGATPLAMAILASQVCICIYDYITNRVKFLKFPLCFLLMFYVFRIKEWGFKIFFVILYSNFYTYF